MLFKTHTQPNTPLVKSSTGKATNYIFVSWKEYSRNNFTINSIRFIKLVKTSSMWLEQPIGCQVITDLGNINSVRFKRLEYISYLIVAENFSYPGNVDSLFTIVAIKFKEVLASLAIKVKFQLYKKTKYLCARQGEDLNLKIL